MLYLGGYVMHEILWLMHVGMPIDDCTFTGFYFYLIKKVKQSWGFRIPMSIGFFMCQWNLDFGVPITVWFWFFENQLSFGLLMNTIFWMWCQWRLGLGFENANENWTLVMKVPMKIGLCAFYGC